MNTAMNKIFRICLALGCLAGIPALSAAQDGRKTCIDQGWKFHYGAAREAISPDFNDMSWRTLDLPHDWSVETEAAAQAGENIGPFSKNNPGGSATGQTVGGEGWYRKTFTLSAADEDKRISLYFEGVYAQSEVWVNGIKVYFNPYGYSSYRFDITDYCKPAGEENTVTVRAVNEGRNTRWYAGSGIYRHVWLMKTPEVYLDEWETAIVTDNLTDETAEISVTSTVFNASALNTELKAAVQLLTPDGRQMADADTVSLSLNAHDEGDAAWKLQVDAPQAWSPETPRLYTARILLLDGEEATDQIDIPFGIRTLEFSAEKGFLLNGEPTKLKGGCVHHDHGLLGAASYDRAEERKAELLKSYGFNAVRCSHNIPAESFLDACDRGPLHHPCHGQVPPRVHPVAVRDEPLGDGVTAGDMAKFVQTNPQYYIPAFVNRKRYHRNRFNFSAFLCSGGWMLYRKQYKWGAIFTGIMLLIYVLSTFISYRFATPIIMDLMQQVGVDINAAYPTMEQSVQFMSLLMQQAPWQIFLVWAPSLLSLLRFALMLFVGFNGNRMYMNHCIRKIRTLREENPDPSDYAVRLQLHGGVNTSLAICLLICYMIVVYLPQLFLY